MARLRYNARPCIIASDENGSALPELSPRQKTAVHYVNGPLLILAGAGSGKTSLLNYKIAWLIKEYGIPPDRIAALMFSYRAVRTMRTRVADLVNGHSTRDLLITTFHGLGLSILRGNLEAAGYARGFSIYAAEDSQALLAQLLRVRGVNQNLAAQVQQQIARWKRGMITPPGEAETSSESIEAISAQIYFEYERRLATANVMDVDDLIWRLVRLLRDHPRVLDEWRERIQYLLVDEYEETSSCQHELVLLLTGNRGALTAAGDDDQCILPEGGGQRNLLRLRTDFPALKVVRLEQNYRSSGRILKAANTILTQNSRVFEKPLWAERQYGEPLRVLKSRGEDHEAERVLTELLSHKFRSGADFRDYAILFRGASQAPTLERALREQRIPYYLRGGPTFFDYTEVQDLMAYLGLICNPADDTAFLRVVNTPRRDIDSGTLEDLKRYATDRRMSLLEASMDPGLDTYIASERLPSLRQFSEWLRNILARADQDPIKLVCGVLADLRYEAWLYDTCNDRKIAERRMENVMHLVHWLQRLAKQYRAVGLSELMAILNQARLLERDSEENPGDFVSLMTLHAAKGLEFPHVFIVGMEEGLLPHHTRLDEQGIQSERRLAYVGITRAQHTLTLSYAERRKRSGEVVACTPSRFIFELPQVDLRWIEQDLDHKPEVPMVPGEVYLTTLRARLRDS